MRRRRGVCVRGSWWWMRLHSGRRPGVRGCCGSRCRRRRRRIRRRGWSFLTSAGDPAHWSRSILEHAEGDPLWRVHEVPGPVPWLDPARVEEQRRRLPESSFERLFLNRWCAGEDRVASLDDLRSCVVLDGPQEPRDGVDYVVGVDLGLKRDRTAIAICHGRGYAAMRIRWLAPGWCSIGCRCGRGRGSSRCSSTRLRTGSRRRLRSTTTPA